MSKHSEFLEKRRQGVGGSDIAAILGESGFKTAVDIWNDKLGNGKPEEEIRPDDPKTASRYWGKILEEPIIKAYEEFERKDVTRGEVYGQIRHPEHEWLIANIDGIAHTPDGDILIEVKNWDHDPQEKWGEKRTDQIPLEYMLQVQHYLNVTGLQQAEVIIRLKGVLKVFPVGRSQTLINYMRVPIKNFWFNNVQKKIAPKAQTLKDVRSIYSCRRGETKQATETEILAVTEARMLKGKISELEKQLKSMKVSIADCMGECETLAAGNERLVTFNQRKDGVRVFKVI